MKQLRSFLGAIGYYRDFIPNFAQTAGPLYDLTKKSVRFKWCLQTNEAWNSLKNMLSSKLILIPPDSSKPFFIATDATQSTIAGVLLQKVDNFLRPIEYFSRRLKDPETRYHTNEIEGLAIFCSIKKWEHYLLMNSATIMTDNSAMTYIFNRKEPCNARVARWQIYLATFKYSIIHVKGRDNHLADFISRNVDHDQLLEKPADCIYNLSIQNPDHPEDPWMAILPHELRSKQEQEPRWKEIIKFLENEKHPTKTCCHAKIKSLSDFVLNEEKILCVLSKKNNQVTLKPVIPNALVPLVLHHVHDSSWAGHPTPRKTRLSAQTKFHWPSLLSDTIHYAKSCILCQKFKIMTQYYPDVIGENKIVPRFPNEALSIDIMYMHPSNNGDRYILSIMDMYSRFTKFYPLKDMFAETVSNIIADHCCDYGFPRIIFTDEGANLSAALTRNIFSLLRIQHSVSIPYRHNPSMVERIHYPLKKGLSILCQGAESTWPKHLRKMTYALNTTIHGSLDCTPMEAYFLRQQNPQPNIGDITLNESCDPDLIDEIKNMRIILTELSESMKEKYIENRNKITKTCPTLDIGEKVMIKRESFTPGINRKMQEIRLGPFKVTDVSGTEIRAELIENPRIIRRRHISHLAPFIERPIHLTQKQKFKENPEIPPIEPTILKANFAIHKFMDPNSIVIIGIECMLRKAGGLAKTIFKSFPYGSMYAGALTVEKPNNEKLLGILRQRATTRRVPGKCTLKYPLTRNPGPIIANLTIQYCPGKAIDNEGLQKVYLERHSQHLDDTLTSSILRDTEEYRLNWFTEALSDLRRQLTDNAITPAKIYIPRNIACGYANGCSKKYWEIIKNFSALMNLSGFEVVAVNKEIKKE